MSSKSRLAIFAIVGAIALCAVGYADVTLAQDSNTTKPDAMSSDSMSSSKMSTTSGMMKKESKKKAMKNEMMNSDTMSSEPNK
jgi:pentapeptide MXKDX repeat protein